MVLTEDTSSFIVGDRVYVDGIKPGRIQYIGTYVLYCKSDYFWVLFFFHPKELVFEPEVLLWFLKDINWVKREGHTFKSRFRMGFEKKND